MISHLGVVQMDAVNVLARAHYVPLFSRLGAFSIDGLDREAYEGRALFEYWGHQASWLPVAMHPLFRWRMERASRLEGIYGGLARFVRGKRRYVDAVLAEVAARGPLRAGELSSSRPRSGSWWSWSDAKTALEWLFWAGRVTTARRRSFERVYDLTERVIPKEILAMPTPSAPDARRALVRLSSRALGIATEDDLADYFRLRLGEVRPHVRELVEEGALEVVTIEGASKPAYLARGAVVPRRAEACAILSPFDPLVWHRPRAERLFGFHYRIGIYTPAHLREHGYYVLPFLLGDALAARVDLKATRDEGVLDVFAAHLEAGAKEKPVAAALAGELRAVASWLELDRVRVARKGSLAPALARHF
ncbi:MAG: YcaQ family DNA glycosylase [Labilithrix sp.]|nr:YcaQ family DNA glycosylase [Labilithrix sp.]